MIYRFGDCDLDSDLRELTRAGDAVAIAPQALDLLLYLIERRDRVVCKDELNRSIWGGRAVTDWALSNCLKTVRRTIGDSGDAQSLVRTLPRRGFRFVGKVDLVDPHCAATRAADSDGDKRGVPSEPKLPSIAVLPFENLTGDAESECFADGITDDIVTSLSAARWLRVIPRHATITGKGGPADIDEIRRELCVRYVLEGGVRSAGPRVRVSARLIDAGADAHIWAEHYDRDVENVFDVQDELTEVICTRVNAELASNERDRAHRKTSPDLDAWDFHQQGMWRLYRNTAEDFVAARKLFEQARERAPEFSGAYSALALAASAELLFSRPENWEETLEQGLRDAGAALEIDDRNNIGHYALGQLSMIKGDRRRCLAALRRAIELDPNFALAFQALGWGLIWFGEAEAAAPHLDRAIRLSPNDPLRWRFLTQRSCGLAVLEETDLALREAREAVRAKRGEFWSHIWLAQASGQANLIGEARASVARAVDLNAEASLDFVRACFASMHPPYLEKISEGLRKAGLPENRPEKRS